MSFYDRMGEENEGNARIEPQEGEYILEINVVHAWACDKLSLVPRYLHINPARV